MFAALASAPPAAEALSAGSAAAAPGAAAGVGLARLLRRPEPVNVRRLEGFAAEALWRGLLLLLLLLVLVLVGRGMRVSGGWPAGVRCLVLARC